MIVFTSDNGGQLSVGANNGPLRDGKQSMYEGGLKVPSIVVWPGHTKAGAETDARLITMDLFPTICEVAGARCPAEVDGLSFLPTLQAPQSALGATVPDRPGKPALQRDLFFHRREGGERYGGLTIQALRRGDWKLLQNSPFQPLELYNVADDPQETRNLAAVNRAKFRDLSKALRAQVQRGGAVPWQPQTE